MTNYRVYQTPPTPNFEVNTVPRPGYLLLNADAWHLPLFLGISRGRSEYEIRRFLNRDRSADDVCSIVALAMVREFGCIQPF